MKRPILQHILLGCRQFYQEVVESTRRIAYSTCFFRKQGLSIFHHIRLCLCGQAGARHENVAADNV